MPTSPFPHRDKSGNYKITFLESVTLQILYDSEKEDYDSFSKFFVEYTNLTLDEDRYKTKKISSMRIIGDEGVASLKFAKNFVEFSINGQAYRGFEENFEGFINKFASFLQSIGSDTSEISIEKVNIWPMDVKEGYPSMDVLKDIIFSKDVQKISRDTNGIGFKEYYDIEPMGLSLLLKYGALPEKDATVPLILDTKCVKTDATSPNRIWSVAKEINSCLNDVFHWAVTEEVITAMQGDINS